MCLWYAYFAHRLKSIKTSFKRHQLMPSHTANKLSRPPADRGGWKLVVPVCKRLQELSIQLLHMLFQALE